MDLIKKSPSKEGDQLFVSGVRLWLFGVLVLRDNGRLVFLKKDWTIGFSN